MKIINASHWKFCFFKKTTRYYSGNVQHVVDWRSCHQAFAVVDWNEKTQSLIAHRDHFGLEPFYYIFTQQCFIFGSTIPDIIRALSSHPEFNFSKLIEDCFPYYKFSNIPYSNETYYKDIYRLEPGHRLFIKNGRLTTETFWQLNPETSLIQYSEQRDYVDHFTRLMHEAVQAQGIDKNTAVEFSGGIDSSSIVVACHQLGLKPGLFCHIVPEGSAELDDSGYAHQIIQHLNLDALQTVDDQHFDPIKTFEFFAMQFAGPAPFIFFMLANNVHQAVTAKGYTRLLSGFGGDECVSGHAPRYVYYPELYQSSGYQAVYAEMRKQGQSNIHAAMNMLRYANPILFELLKKMGLAKHHLKSYLQWKRPEPYDASFSQRYSSLRQFEYELLQGQQSHHVRMRIEYSAVTAKALGFSYAYPLLYPPLVEFCFRLPLAQKRRDGFGRQMIRQYLAQYLPEALYSKNQKRGGILPATMHRCKTDLQTGKFAQAFKDLPFQDRLHPKASLQYQLIAKINAYMLKHYCNKNNRSYDHLPCQPLA